MPVKALKVKRENTQFSTYTTRDFPSDETENIQRVAEKGASHGSPAEKCKTNVNLEWKWKHSLQIVLSMLLNRRFLLERS